MEFSLSPSSLPQVFVGEGGTMPTCSSKDGYNIHVAEETTLEPGQRAFISTQLYWKLPSVCALVIRNRYDINRLILSVEQDMIGSTYAGELKIMVTNHSTSRMQVDKGFVIAQAVLVNVFPSLPTMLEPVQTNSTQMIPVEVKSESMKASEVLTQMPPVDQVRVNPTMRRNRGNKPSAKQVTPVQSKEPHVSIPLKYGESAESSAKRISMPVTQGGTWAVPVERDGTDETKEVDDDKIIMTPVKLDVESSFPN